VAQSRVSYFGRVDGKPSLRHVTRYGLGREHGSQLRAVIDARISDALELYDWRLWSVLGGSI
jgi:hypothetical protein